MYPYEYELAKQHVNELIKEAENHRLAILAKQTDPARQNHVSWFLRVFKLPSKLPKPLAFLTNR